MRIDRSGAMALALLAVAALGWARAAGAEERVRFTPPKAGTVAEYRLITRVHTDRRIVKRTFRVITTTLADRSPYKGVAVFRQRNELRRIPPGNPGKVSIEVVVRRLADGNEIAFLDQRGQTTRTVTPHGGIYRWPAAVGDRWRSKTVRRALRSGRTKTLEIAYRVAAIENVALPAGTFKAVRIDGRIGKTSEITYWFLPELGIEGRWTLSQAVTTKIGNETVRKIQYETVLVKLTRP